MAVAAGRRYGEPVEVRRRDEAPAEFLWRSRLHVVRAVLAHWFEAGGWWEVGAVPAASPAEPVAGPAAGPDDGEREMWRVEAAAGASAGTGLYDLCFEWATGGWTLARVLD